MRKSLVLFALLSPALTQQAFADAPASSGIATDSSIKKEEAPRFYGFAFDFSIFDGTGLNGPAYANSINMYFEPTWNVGRQWFRGTRFAKLALAGRFVLSRALAGYDETFFSGNSDQGRPMPCTPDLKISPQGQLLGVPNRCSTPSPDRWDYSDIWLTVKNPKIATIPVALINFNPAVRLVFPTSAQSRFQSMLLSLTGSLGASRSFFNDKLTLAYSFGVTKYFHRHTSPGSLPNSLQDGNVEGISTRSIDSLANFYLDPAHAAAEKALNPNYGFTHIFDVEYNPTDKWSISLLYILFDTFSYSARCGDQAYGNQVTDTCANANTVSMTAPPSAAAALGAQAASTSGGKIKDTQVLWITVGYQALDWLNLSVAWINWAPLRKEDNSYRQGIISTNYDAFTTLNFGATVSIEKAAAKLF